MNSAGPARILIAGAGGFAGRHLLPALRRAFPSAIFLAGSRQRAVAGTDMTLLLDLNEPAGLPGAIAAARPDAALILASSGEVYGLSFQTGDSLNEAAASSPANPYAASKAAADIAIGEMALRGLRTVRLRTFAHSGAGQTSAFVVAAFARQIARIEAGLQEPIVHTGALDRWRDFLDVRDVCAAYVAALRAPLAIPPRLGDEHLLGESAARRRRPRGPDAPVRRHRSHRGAAGLAAIDGCDAGSRRRVASPSMP